MKRYMFRISVLLIVGQFVLTGCTPSAPDYAMNVCWVAKPKTIDKPVDVFFVYPTIYDEKTPKNMDIHRTDLRDRAKYVIAAQASVFTSSTNVFAPYYRQMTMAELAVNKDTYADPAFKTGVGDVLRAFEYYLKNLNRDRPFILAGHSQGSMVLIDLMRKRFDDPVLQKRLVAAYLIGYSVTQDDLKKYPCLKPARASDDTGVIISFNTQAPGATGSPVLLPGAICINPLNWKIDETPAEASLNIGAVFFDEATHAIGRETPHYTAARIEASSGALVTTPPESLDIGSFPKGVYHRYDYAFWYRNLQENVAERTKAYLNK